MIGALEPNDSPDIGFVWEWSEFQMALVDQSRADVLRQLLSGVTVLRPHEAQFIGLTREEVETYFDLQRNQLELLIMFELLATTEAILRIDFKTRVAAKKKDRLSRRYREIDKARGDRIRLDEDLLNAIKTEDAVMKAVTSFRSVLKLRHWLAHGRHWHPKFGRGYAPNDVFDICRDLIILITPL